MEGHRSSSVRVTSPDDATMPRRFSEPAAWPALFSLSTRILLAICVTLFPLQLVWPRTYPRRPTRAPERHAPKSRLRFMRWPARSTTKRLRSILRRAGKFGRDRSGAAVRPARSHAGFARRAQARASKCGRARPDGRSMHADGVSRAGDIREAEFRRGDLPVRRRRFRGASARAQVWLRCACCIAACSATLTCRAAALRGTNTAAAASISRTACAPSD